MLTLAMPCLRPSQQRATCVNAAFVTPTHLVQLVGGPVVAFRSRKPNYSCCSSSGPASHPLPPPSARPDDYVRVRVFAVGPPDPPTSATLLTLLPVSATSPNTPAGKVAFRIAVSDHQAAAIRDVILTQAMPQASPRRPTTHALLLSALRSFRASVAEAAITAVAGDVFVASLHLGAPSVIDDAHRALDARPSDAIALSALVDAPLYLRRELLDRWPVSLGSVEADVRAGLCECLPPFASLPPPPETQETEQGGSSDLFLPGADTIDVGGDRYSESEENERKPERIAGSDPFKFPPSPHVWVSAAEAAPASNSSDRSSRSRRRSQDNSSLPSPPSPSSEWPLESVSSTPQSCEIKRHPTLARLEFLAARLDVAVRLERFREAAELRDEMERICPVQRMQSELEQACADEDFATAAVLRDRMAEWETTLERWDAEGVCGDIEVVADGVEPGEVLVVPGSEMAAGGPNLTEFAATAFALGVDVGLSPEAAAGFYIDDDMEGFYEGDEQQLQWLSSWEDSTIEGDECDHFDNDGASSGVSDMPSSDGTERPSAGGTGAVDDSSDINSCGEDAT